MNYDEESEVLSIFSKYIPVDSRYNAVHTADGKTWAGPDPSVVAIDDMIRLAQLGWHEDNESGCFYHINR